MPKLGLLEFLQYAAALEADPHELLTRIMRRLAEEAEKT